MIILYKGHRGCGKTLTMVKDALLYHLSKHKVYRNFPCSFGTFISNDDILALDKNSELRDCVLMIDEIQIFFDSRSSISKENRRFSNFIQQIRKRKIIILCTTQFSNTIDLRLRQHIDYMVYPDFDSSSNYCTCTYVDVTSFEPDILSITQKLPVYFTLIYNAQSIFNLYDTDYIVA